MTHPDDDPLAEFARRVFGRPAPDPAAAPEVPAEADDTTEDTTEDEERTVVRQLFAPTADRQERR